MSKPEIKIFLVDDHEVVLNGLKAILNPPKVASVVPLPGDSTPDVIELSSEFRVIGSALHAEAMLEQLPKLPIVDLLIIDCELPGMNGIEAAHAAKNLRQNLKTIVFSMRQSFAIGS